MNKKSMWQEARNWAVEWFADLIVKTVYVGLVWIVIYGLWLLCTGR